MKLASKSAETRAQTGSLPGAARVHRDGNDDAGSGRDRDDVHDMPRTLDAARRGRARPILRRSSRAMMLGRLVDVTLAFDDAVGPYRAPAWLAGGHAQTIYPYFLPRPPVRYRRERVETPDGDVWDFDWLDEGEATEHAPLVVLFHGLEGGSRSHYACMLMRALVARRWRGVVPHFRGCGGELNRLPRAYHSGDHEEIGGMLDAVRRRAPIDGAPLYAAGVSLGGSALLNWLGRAGAAATSMIDAAAAISVPLDLGAAGRSIGVGLNRIYTMHFLQTLKPKSLAMARRFPGLLDESRVRAVRTMYEFDDAVTAPMHGFAGTDDYWSRASSKRWLARVDVPTLVLNAKNDPFVPGSSLPDAASVSRSVRLEQPDAGGHVGFCDGPFPGRIDWLPRRLLQFFGSRR
jgi:predicted alpha/beta-fold hydrolase